MGGVGFLVVLLRDGSHVHENTRKAWLEGGINVRYRGATAQASAHLRSQQATLRNEPPEWMRRLLNFHAKLDQCVEQLALVVFRMELDNNVSFHETE